MKILNCLSVAINSCRNEWSVSNLYAEIIIMILINAQHSMTDYTCATNFISQINICSR